MVSMTRQEMDDMIGEERINFAKFQTELFIYAISVGLHDLYGFGRERNLRALIYILMLVAGMCENEEMIEECKKEVYERFGITVEDVLTKGE